MAVKIQGAVFHRVVAIGKEYREVRFGTSPISAHGLWLPFLLLKTMLKEGYVPTNQQLHRMGQGNIWNQKMLTRLLFQMLRVLRRYLNMGTSAGIPNHLIGRTSNPSLKIYLTPPQ